MALSRTAPIDRSTCYYHIDHERGAIPDCNHIKELFGSLPRHAINAAAAAAAAATITIKYGILIAHSYNLTALHLLTATAEPHRQPTSSSHVAGDQQFKIKRPSFSIPFNFSALPRP